MNYLLLVCCLQSPKTKLTSSDDCSRVAHTLKNKLCLMLFNIFDAMRCNTPEINKKLCRAAQQKQESAVNLCFAHSAFTHAQIFPSQLKVQPCARAQTHVWQGYAHYVVCHRVYGHTYKQCKGTLTVLYNILMD